MNDDSRLDCIDVAEAQDSYCREIARLTRKVTSCEEDRRSTVLLLKRTEARAEELEAEKSKMIDKFNQVSIHGDKLRRDIERLEAALHSHPDREKLIVDLRALHEQQKTDLHEFASMLKKSELRVKELGAVVEALVLWDSFDRTCPMQLTKMSTVLKALVSQARKAAEAAKPPSVCPQMGRRMDSKPLSEKTGP